MKHVINNKPFYFMFIVQCSKNQHEQVICVAKKIREQHHMINEMPKGSMWSSVPLPQLLLNLCIFL